jgi:hypothetical protein
MATDSVTLAAASSIIGGLFWYSYQDLGTDPSTPENFYGLRRFDGSPKPAYAAFQTAIALAQTSRTASPHRPARFS